MSDEAPLATDLPERRLLRPDRSYVFLILLGGIVLTGASAYLVEHPMPNFSSFVAWSGLIFFGLATLAGLGFLLVPQTGGLELTREGFRLQSRFYKNYPITPWDAIARIETRQFYTSIKLMLSHKVVAIDYLPAYRGSSKIASGLRRLNRETFMFDEMIEPRFYGFDADTLATLMNHYREHALPALNMPASQAEQRESFKVSPPFE